MSEFDKLFQLIDDFANGIYFEGDPKRFNGTKEDDIIGYVKSNYLPLSTLKQVIEELTKPYIDQYGKTHYGLIVSGELLTAITKLGDSHDR